MAGSKSLVGSDTCIQPKSNWLFQINFATVVHANCVWKLAESWSPETAARDMHMIRSSIEGIEAQERAYVVHRVVRALFLTQIRVELGQRYSQVGILFGGPSSLSKLMAGHFASDKCMIR